MKRIILALAAIIMTLNAFAMDFQKAFEKIAAIPGAMQTEIPAEELKKNNIDNGKITMINDVTDEARTTFNNVIGDIDGDVFLDTTKDNVVVKIFKTDAGNGKIRILMAIDAGKNIVAFFAEGDNEMLNDLKLP